MVVKGGCRKLRGGKGNRYRTIMGERGEEGNKCVVVEGGSLGVGKGRGGAAEGCDMLYVS